CEADEARRPARTLWYVTGAETEVQRRRWPSAARVTLGDFDRRAGVGELLLDLRGLILGQPLLHDLGNALDEILGLLEAEVRDLADRLDDVDLVGTDLLERDLELGLLGGRCSSRRRRSRRHCGRCCGDAPLLL